MFFHVVVVLEPSCDKFRDALIQQQQSVFLGNGSLTHFASPRIVDLGKSNRNNNLFVSFLRLAFACPGPSVFLLVFWLRCVEQNPRIPRLEFREFVPATACVSFFLSFLHVRCTAHCHQQCARANLANRASHISCNRFFHGVMTPHACKARPLTTVGRTSLSVIIIINNTTKHHKTHHGDTK